eukprot:104192-Hanusia_phi.AAC.1
MTARLKTCWARPVSTQLGPQDTQSEGSDILSMPPLALGTGRAGPAGSRVLPDSNMYPRKRSSR